MKEISFQLQVSWDIYTQKNLFKTRKANCTNVQFTKEVINLHNNNMYTQKKENDLSDSE
jgi:hypothetical protein